MSLLCCAIFIEAKYVTDLGTACAENWRCVKVRKSVVYHRTIDYYHYNVYVLRLEVVRHQQTSLKHTTKFWSYMLGK